MEKKKMMPVLLLLVLVCAFCVQARFETNLTLAYTFNNVDTSGTTIFNKMPFTNGTLHLLTTGRGGIIGEAYNWTGTDDDYAVAANHGWNATKYTMSIWFNSSVPFANTDYNAIFRWGTSAGSTFDFSCYTGFGDDSVYCSGYNAAGGTLTTMKYSNTTLDTGWHQVVVVLNTTQASLFIDGQVMNQSGINGNWNMVGTEHFYFGSNLMKTEEFVGILDEPRAWIGRQLTPDEILTNYNNYLQGIYEFSAFNVVSTYPPNNSLRAASILDVNLSINSTQNFNCSLLVNGLVNQTKNNQSAGQVKMNFNVSFKSDEDAGFNVSAYCVDYDEQEYNKTTETVFFTIDNVVPLATINSPTGTRSMLYNIPFTVSINETNLNTSSCFYNITRSDGTLVISNTALTNCTSTTFNLAEYNTFTASLFFSDLAGNNGTATSAFTLNSEGGGTTVVITGGSTGGGGAGTTTVILGNITLAFNPRIVDTYCTYSPFSYEGINKKCVFSVQANKKLKTCEIDIGKCSINEDNAVEIEIPVKSYINEKDDVIKPLKGKLKVVAADNELGEISITARIINFGYYVGFNLPRTMPELFFKNQDNVTIGIRPIPVFGLMALCGGAYFVFRTWRPKK